jgi:3'(2'), 5'-bisphosphate nucleotidase
MANDGAASDAAYAAQLARAAGHLLLGIQRSARPDEVGSGELKDRGDREAQAFLDSRIRVDHPRDGILSEEAADNAGRLAKSRVWIIDPLDGTREFSEGRHDWAVHVALWQDGRLAAGAVALPGLDHVFSSADLSATPARPERLRLAVSRSRPPALVDYLVEHMDIDLIPLGSAGYKTLAVVRGEADAYVHAGGQFEWDSAAPVAVALAAGLHASRIDGSALRYNQPSPYLPDLLVCDPDRAPVLLAIIAEFLKEVAHE